MKKLLIIPLAFLLAAKCILLGSCTPDKVKTYTRVNDQEVWTFVFYEHDIAWYTHTSLNSPDSVIEAQYKEAEGIASKLKKLR